MTDHPADIDTGSSIDPLDHSKEGLRDPSAHPEQEPRVGTGQQPRDPTATGLEHGDMAAGAPPRVDHAEEAVRKRERPKDKPKGT